MYDDMFCPHCKGKLTIKQAVEILNGTGYERPVRVKAPDGSMHILAANLINPREVEILETP